MAASARRSIVIWLSGWAPHESQPQPLKPGSAKASLEAAVKREAGLIATVIARSEATRQSIVPGMPRLDASLRSQ